MVLRPRLGDEALAEVPPPGVGQVRALWAEFSVGAARPLRLRWAHCSPSGVLPYLNRGGLGGLLQTEMHVPAGCRVEGWPP